MKSIVALILILLLTLCGCQSRPDSTQVDEINSVGEESASDTVSASDTADFSKSDADMFTDRDLKTDYDEDKSTHILLNGNSATADSDAVKISGTNITITDKGTYILSGELDDGMITVNAEDTDKPQLVLDNVTINSESSAPIYILEADKVIITLAEGSVNTLSNGGTFTAIDENNIDAAVFSKQDLTFNGDGSLEVISPAGHGIVSKDDLVFTSGSYSVASASHGIDANDSVRVINSSITVDAGKDGIHAENDDDTSLGFVYLSSGSFTVDAEGDGISAESYMQINSGDFDIVTGGGSVNSAKQTSDSWGGFMGGGDPSGMGGMGGMGRPGEPTAQTNDTAADSSNDSSSSIKALKSTGSLQINGGNFTIDSADDAIHSNYNITINGGSFEIASGDDGFHADETLSITAGTINISESYEGLEGLNVNVSGGDIGLVARDDGFNAAGGTDSSGFGGNRGNDMFGGGPGGSGGPGGPGGPGGEPMSGSSNGSIVISGGNIYINASGDGLDANGTLEISGGYIVVCGPTQGDTATLDYDVSGVITGGTFIGTGASNMAQTFSDSEQGVVAISVGNQAAGTQIILSDTDGNEIITYAPELSFDVVILSSPEIISGMSYTMTVGSQSGEFTAS